MNQQAMPGLVSTKKWTFITNRYNCWVRRWEQKRKK